MTKMTHPQPIYHPQEIEEKWLAVWEQNRLFQQSEQQPISNAENKLYLLFAFAYPSGAGLHVGHVESMTALDILARYYRMRGKNVFFPVGWDAFGLPAENYAIKTGVHPAETTNKAIHTFRRQVKRMGVTYDWANEIATCHPEYYRWTQWLFGQLYQAGLAYQGTGMVNWCPSCQTVLANEQVVNGACERCGTQVVQKELKQWFFKITQYRDELISGLEQVDWPAATKQQQLNWIGKSKGLNIDFTLKQTGQTLTVWTKFWETVFGTTFVVMAPEKFQQLDLISMVPPERREAVAEYIDQAFHKTEEERKIGEKDKTGIETGLTVINPVNGSEVPLFVADYVLMNVGTAVVMGVPAHDDRDFAFAKKFGLAIIQVVSYDNPEIDQQVKAAEIPYEGEGKLVNSGQFDGQDAWGEGKRRMAEWMIEQGFAQWQTTYKLRDWLISRQRYWGAPIPVIYDPDGQPHLVDTAGLPWELPTDVDFKPTGESPLTSSVEFQQRTEQHAAKYFAKLIADKGWDVTGKGWRPEYDTMDTFVDSSWYYLRYVDARNRQEFASREQMQRWLPVDFYMIGPEHIVLHLLYSRFFTKFLRDQGYLKFDEPFLKMRHQGMILGPDGRKMSKSKGNVINPDDVVDKFGADTLRMYEMFMGPIEADKPWDVTAVAGIYRFLVRIYNLVSAAKMSNDLVISDRVRRKLHQTIKKVTHDIPELKFNTAIAMMMELVNVWEAAVKDKPGVTVLATAELTAFVQLLAPFAPFLAEELYQLVDGRDGAGGDGIGGDNNSVHQSDWPAWDVQLAADQFTKIAVQINGKIRGELSVEPAAAADEAMVLAQAKQLASVQRYLTGQELVKEIYIPGRIVSLVVE